MLPILVAIGMMARVMEPSPSRYHGSSASNPAAAHSPAALSSAAHPVSVNPVSRVRFGGEDSAHSLAEMARRDLDAALQLLADRAQYITGASGAAIALRRNGRNDMLCRASTGSNAPELGALLSTEYGLSGESVRTRQPLRCDDAERDVRVNREVCRQLGIASVVVMPVVNDDEVLGVFELFSGRVNAFGERDLSAVQRLSQLVETAVRLAEIAENLPEQLRASETSAPAVENTVENAEVEDKVLEAQILDESGLEDMIPQELIPEEVILEEPVLEEVVPTPPKPKVEVRAEASAAKADLSQADLLQSEALAEKGESAAAAAPPDAKIPVVSEKAREDAAPMVVATIGGTATAVPEPPKTVVPEKVVAELRAAATKAEPVPAPSAETAVPKKPLFWSAEIHPAADAAKLEEVDHSHVPPVLRSLRKCEACGFPISAGRVLCVECEEKKWRGQLKVPRAAAPPRQVANAVPIAPLTSGLKTEALKAEGLKTEAPKPKTETRAFGAAAQSVGGSIPALSRQMVPEGMKDPKEITEQLLPLLPRPTATGPAAPPTPSARAPEPLVASSPAFVLSAGLEPAQSWLSANKYVIGVLLVVGIVVAAFLLLR